MRGGGGGGGRGVGWGGGGGRAICILWNLTGEPAPVGSDDERGDLFHSAGPRRETAVAIPEAGKINGQRIGK